MTTFAPNKSAKDIGKRVRWHHNIYNEQGTGTLVAVDCDIIAVPYLIQRDDGGGWTLELDDIGQWHKKARLQGVKDGTPNLWWVSSYEVIDSSTPSVPTTFWSESLLVSSLRYWHLANPPKQTLMSKVTDTLKNLTLSKTDRILRENGFEDDCGNITHDTRKAMLTELATDHWKTKRDDVAKKLLAEKK